MMVRRMLMFRKTSVTALFLTAASVLLLAGFGNSIAQLAFTFPGAVHSWMSPAYTSPYSTADELLNAAMPTSGGVVLRFLPTSPPAFQFWNGSAGNGFPMNFPLEIGEGYSLVPVLTENVILNGSHSPAVIPQGQNALPAVPAAGIPLGGSIPPGMIANVDYLVAIPWTTTMVEAEDLRVAFGASYVTRCVAVLGKPPAFFFWTGFSGNDPIKQNFDLDVRQSYVARSLTTSSGVVLP